MSGDKLQCRPPSDATVKILTSFGLCACADQPRQLIDDCKALSRHGDMHVVGNDKHRKNFESQLPQVSLDLATQLLKTTRQLEWKRKADTGCNDEFESKEWDRVHPERDDRNGFVGGRRDGHDVRVKRQTSATVLSNREKSRKA